VFLQAQGSSSGPIWLSGAYGYSFDITFEAGSTLRRIGARAFENVVFSSIRIPASVQSIGESCFETCLWLEELTFEPGSQLRRIGDKAFLRCELKTVAIPESVEVIGEGRFYRCEKLSEVIFERDSQLRTIGKEVFKATALTAIRIPAKVQLGQMLCLEGAAEIKLCLTY
jgi:hypothetical protein